MINISHILLLFLVAIVIFWIFESINQKHSENFGSEVEHQNDIKAEPILPMQKTYRHVEESPIIPKLETIPTINSCPLKENDMQTEYYISKHLMGNGSDNCPRPTKSVKQFNKDFFNFRDYTFRNSSMTLDSVDKVANMYLDGDLGEARRFPNTKIRDIYDSLTCGPQLYERKCARIPQFDNTMPILLMVCI